MTTIFMCWEKKNNEKEERNLAACHSKFLKKKPFFVHYVFFGGKSLIENVKVHLYKKRTIFGQGSFKMSPLYDAGMWLWVSRGKKIKRHLYVNWQSTMRIADLSRNTLTAPLTLTHTHTHNSVQICLNSFSSYFVPISFERKLSSHPIK